jgi:hypothetical protein
LDEIRAVYDLGQRDFGENYVQELLAKQPRLPDDIRWHFIGHLQTNKVRAIAPFVHLIQSVDSQKLLREIDKQAARCGRVIDCLLQVHIAAEETKFGFDAVELKALLGEGGPHPGGVAGSAPGNMGPASAAAFPQELRHVRVLGLMGMASLTEDPQRIAGEFRELRSLWQTWFGNLPDAMLSMGMSGDYRIAIREGSNMIRIGSLLFGAREKR